jgi:hypothetical protein
MDIQEVRFGYVDWIYLYQDRGRSRVLVNEVMNQLTSLFNKLQEIS